MIIKKITILLLFLFPILIIGQTNSENYIKKVTYKIPSATVITAPTINQASENVTYFDGLGRPVQEIASQQSSTGKDIVTHISYDAFGRQIKEYLPYASTQNTKAYIDPTTLETNLIAQYKGIYGTANDNPYSEKVLESSPLNRILKQAAPGNDWKKGVGHEIKINYQTNINGEVKLFTAAATWSTTFGLYDIALGNAAGTAFYSANQLYKTITYDENTAASPSESNGSIVEFKNKLGQVVLKRTYSTVGTGTANEQHDTYYVYDTYGNLTYVIPPKADSNITVSVLNDLCYQYKYDNRNRLVEKKLPGKQWEFIVYDKLDRVIATGPVLSPFSDITSEGWNITKYDVLGRPVITGWMAAVPTSGSRKTLQEIQNGYTTNFSETKIATATNTTVNGVAFRYTNVAWPTSLYHILTVNYFDDYNFPDAPTVPSSIESQAVYYNSVMKPRGLQVATWTRILETSSLYKKDLAYSFFDEKGRVIRSYMQNFLGGYTYTDTKLDFVGKPDYTTTRHKRLSSSTELKTKEVFSYSSQGRLHTQTHQINDGAIELIASNGYDEFGQLISKKVGNNTTSPTQKVDYNYNIRGWLTAINDINALAKGGDPKDLFAFKINYNTSDSGISGVNALYNGNIAETQWATNSDNGIVRTYGYQYDKLNRLKAGIYKKQASISNVYNESLDYDKNGNIMHLIRYGSLNDNAQTLIDNLTYNYANSNVSNKLASVDDAVANNSNFINEFKNTAGIDYSYDANGNIISDGNKGIIAISYNHLNLPAKITFGTTGNIVYIYNAAGQKVQKVVTITSPASTTITDYLGGYQYKKLNTGTVDLKFFPTDEGYVEPNGSSYKYLYQYKDHLGNIRLSYDKSLVIQEENNYYPFGLKHVGYNIVTGYTNDALKYKYQGQERQDELGLNWDSFKWRNYDPAISRFMSIDPLAEDYSYQSPYAFCENTPIAFRELEGLEKVLAIFYHGGPTGGGKPTTVGNAGYTGQYFKNTQSAATANNKEFEGRIIAPGATSASGVQEGIDFFNATYEQGDQVIIYGYSYGVDVAVDLAEALNAASVPIDLLITVDGSDGPLQNITVNNTIPANVKTNLNVYQTSNSGASSASRVTGSTSGATSKSTSGSNSSGSSNKSKSGSSNSPGSSGGTNKASNSKKTNVVNKNVSGAGVNHGNVQQKASSIINPVINSTVKKR